jgi:hypothetical protein
MVRGLQDCTLNQHFRDASTHSASPFPKQDRGGVLLTAECVPQNSYADDIMLNMTV